MKNNLFPIASAGWTYIGGSVLFFVLFAFLDLDLLQFLAFLATLFFLFVFRNPEREYMYYQEDSVVSPVDGIITSIKELTDNKQYAYKIEVDGNYLNVPLLRTPFTSSITYVHKQHGARLSPLSSLSQSLNEYSEIIFTDNNSNSIKVVHRLKQGFMPIEIYAIKSQKLYQGSRYGVVVNGMTTIYLPLNFRLNISTGAELKAAETLLGYFTKTH